MAFTKTETKVVKTIPITVKEMAPNKDHYTIVYKYKNKILASDIDKKTYLKLKYCKPIIVEKKNIEYSTLTTLKGVSTSLSFDCAENYK